MAVGFSGSNGGITTNVRKIDERTLSFIRKALAQKLLTMGKNTNVLKAQGANHGNRTLGQ